MNNDKSLKEIHIVILDFDGEDKLLFVNGLNEKDVITYLKEIYMDCPVISLTTVKEISDICHNFSNQGETILKPNQIAKLPLINNLNSSTEDITKEHVLQFYCELIKLCKTEERLYTSKYLLEN